MGTCWFTLVRSSVHRKHETLTQCWSNAGPLSATLAQHQTSFNASCLLGCVQPSKHKTFLQCWSNGEDVVPTLYKCYTNALCLLGIAACLVLLAAYCWPRLQADTDPMSCLLGVFRTKTEQIPLNSSFTDFPLIKLPPRNRLLF